MIIGKTTPEEAARLTAEMNAPGSYAHEMRELMTADTDFGRECAEHPHVWLPKFSGPGECKATGFPPELVDQ
jgi:hypothetical protein